MLLISYHRVSFVHPINYSEHLASQWNSGGKKQRKVKRPAVAGSQTQDTSGLSHQYSVTEARHTDNHQPSQSSICTAQVVLNASAAHLAATQYVPSELH